MLACNTPSSQPFSISAGGSSPASSASWATGRISFWAKRCTASTSMRCSSVGSNPYIGCSSRGVIERVQVLQPNLAALFQVLDIGAGFLQRQQAMVALGFVEQPGGHLRQGGGQAGEFQGVLQSLPIQIADLIDPRFKVRENI